MVDAAWPDNADVRKNGVVMSSEIEEPADERHRIVVGVDGSENANRALEWAAVQAERTGALLEIHAAYGAGNVLFPPSEVEGAMRRLVENATKQARHVAPQVGTRAVTDKGPPAPALIEASDDADLLVVGSRGLGGFRGLLLGSVSQQCSTHARCPVVVVQ
jgi:nucleotide-binding universal stress UspA family protein